MEITIIGWYGTETIGDRAILAGIFRILSESIVDYSVRLGSLFPFFTQRTVIEDNDFYKKVSKNDKFAIKIFDSRNPRELRKNIKHTDILMVGGGPLMDLQEMAMLDYAFNLASQFRKKIVLMGCGWGPLKTNRCINIARRLIDLASIVIFRDETSKEQAVKNGCDKSKIHSIADPAIFACHHFIQNILSSRSEDYIAINLRDVSLEGKHYADNPVPQKFFIDVIESVISQTDVPIRLVPMHNFFIGGDDRVFLNGIKQNFSSKNVIVEQVPMSLYETMEKFYHAKACVGMRFHSVLLQSILNGNNYILDYLHFLIVFEFS